MGFAKYRGGGLETCDSLREEEKVPTLDDPVRLGRRESLESGAGNQINMHAVNEQEEEMFWTAFRKNT